MKSTYSTKNVWIQTQSFNKITEKIKQACDSGQYACGVFLDLQKAFSTKNHDILLKKSTIMVSGQQLTSGFSHFQKIENSSPVLKVVILLSNQSGMVYFKAQFQDSFFLFYLLMTCTKLLNSVLLITWPMILNFFQSVNHLKRLTNISTEIQK